MIISFKRQDHTPQENYLRFVKRLSFALIRHLKFKLAAPCSKQTCIQAFTTNSAFLDRSDDATETRLSGKGIWSGMGCLSGSRPGYTTFITKKNKNKIKKYYIMRSDRY